MLSCRDFVKQKNEQLDGQDFTLMQRLSMKMHYFICHHCRRYFKQLLLVNRVSEKLPQPEVDPTKIETCIDHIHLNQEQKEN